MTRPNKIMTREDSGGRWSLTASTTEMLMFGYTKYQKAGRFGGAIEPVAFWVMQFEYVQVFMDDVGVFGDSAQLYYRYSDPKTGKSYTFGQDSVMHS